MLDDALYMLAVTCSAVVSVGVWFEYSWKETIEAYACCSKRLVVRGKHYWIVPASRESCECLAHECAKPVQYPGATWCLGHGQEYGEPGKETR